MVTFHPSASPVRGGGFRPMVIVRRPDGKLAGNRYALAERFPNKELARNFARNAAHTAAIKLGNMNARVA